MWNERHVQILNAVKTSQVGLGLLGGCAKVFKERPAQCHRCARRLGPSCKRSLEAGGRPCRMIFRSRNRRCHKSSTEHTSLREYYPKQVESPYLAPKSIRNCLRTSGRSLIGSTALTRRKSNSLRRGRFSPTSRSSIRSIPEPMFVEWWSARSESASSAARKACSARLIVRPAHMRLFCGSYRPTRLHCLSAGEE
jgi:hypothetical protein